MSHDHKHAVSKGSTGYGRAFLVGAVLNIGFVLIEAFYGWKSESLALMADAAHNLSDVAGLLLAWFATVVVRLKPNERHTYGWRKATILAAFVNALVLILAMVFLFKEAFHRLEEPMQYAGTTMMIVASVGVIVNGFTAWLFMSSHKSDLNMRGVFLHMGADALISLGVVIAGGVYLLSGWNWLDPVVSMAIAVIVLLSSLSLFKKSLHLVFDGVPENINLAEVQELLLAQPGVINVHDIHIWGMSDTDIALTTHLIVSTSYPDNHLLHDLSHLLHKKYGINHPTIQVEVFGDELHCARLNSCQID